MDHDSAKRKRLIAPLYPILTVYCSSLLTHVLHAFDLFNGFS